MSNSHLDLLKTSVIKPLSVLRKEVNTYKSSSNHQNYGEVYLSDILEELIALDMVKNKKIPARRIFVHSNEGGVYNEVGWIIYDDIEYCMLCKKAFGVFSTKMSCYACGNVFCAQCCYQEAYIFEIQSLGKLRACDLCCYGQVRPFPKRMNAFE